MESKDDEDISIDFGKIKNFFKSDKKEEEKRAEPFSPEKKEEEDIQVDFGKIKNFFKSITAGNTEESSIGGKKDSEDIPINWSKLAEFFKTYGILLLILIPIIFSIFIRMQAGLLLFTNDWAASSVINNIRSQIQTDINQHYPNLPEATKSTLVDAQLQKAINSNRQQVDKQVNDYSNYFKAFFQDDKGYTYMPDIDPYYWFRYAKNIVDHGHPGDIVKDGREWDKHQLAPNGRPVKSDLFHVYYLVYL